MKQTHLFLKGILGLALVFGLVLTGCPTEGGTDPENKKVATPTASPAAGEVASGTTVTLSTTTTGAEIYYTTDGTTPSKSSTPYTAPIAITAQTTIKAIAVKEGMTDSEVLTAAYTIRTGGGDPTPEPEQPLPAPSGTNALSGKTYLEGEHKTVFSPPSSEGASKGNYSIHTVKCEIEGNQIEGYTGSFTFGDNDKYPYTEIETGTYSWNETEKTITLKPEKAVIINNGYEPLRDKAAYRLSLQALLDQIKNKWGDEVVNQKLAAGGFSTAAAYIEYEVNQAFINKTRTYSFSADSTALFLDQSLPPNKGTNELTGKTFTNQRNNNETLAFTSDGYTVTQNSSVIETGIYTYDSIHISDGGNGSPQVYLKASAIDDKDRAAYYASLTSTEAGPFATPADKHAAETNSMFRVRHGFYKVSGFTIVIDN